MPKVITRKTKLQIYKCFKHFKSVTPSAPQHELIARIRDIFEISRQTVLSIISKEPHELQTSYCSKRGKTVFWDYMFRKDLQRRIWAFHSKNEHFSLDMLLKDVQENLQFEGGRTTLYKILKSMGYKYKTVNSRKILCQQKHVIAAKIKFLRKFLQLQKLGNDILFVYLDETWVYQNGQPVRRWIHETDIKSNPGKVKAEGKRFTILHAGCKFGFLPCCDYLLDSRNNDRDYHKSMNGERFVSWIKNQLLPALQNLPGKKVIVMDNAPYHSVEIDKPPSYSSKKQEMKEWLLNQNIQIAKKITKKELWQQIKPLRHREKKFVVGNLVAQHGHEVLRLPPYHCEFNAIEMAWAFCKGYYNKHISAKFAVPAKSTVKISEIWQEALLRCTPEMWKNYCQHTEKLIADSWQSHMGLISVDDVPPLIISLGESESEDETSTSESSE